MQLSGFMTCILNELNARRDLSGLYLLSDGEELALTDSNWQMGKLQENGVKQPLWATMFSIP